MATSTAPTIVSLIALLLIALPQGLQAHGGGLHGWDWLTPGYNYPRYRLAGCTVFSGYNAASGNSFIPGLLPYWATTSPALIATGGVDVYAYLDATCTVTHALTPLFTLTNSSGSPYLYQKVYAYGMTGTCGAGVQDIYRHNQTLGTTRFNMAWWRDAVTDVNGTIWGAAPNTWLPRSPSQGDVGSASPSLQSLLLVPPPDDSPMLCCDLAWTAPLPLSWDAAVAACKVPAETVGHR